jgi:hypothetical protein
MINAEILTKPFIMLYLNLDLQSLINDDLISEHNYNILSSIGDKIVEIMPSGKISNLYKEKYHNSDRFWNRQSILSNIITYMDYDIKSDLTQFKRDFFKDLSLEEEVALYIKVFQPLVDKLYQNHLEKMKIISEAINA